MKQMKWKGLKFDISNRNVYPPKPASLLLAEVAIIKFSKDFREGWEGDLSAGIRAMVPRAISCIVVGLDRHGKKVKYNLRDFHARVFQHEIDHLNGIFLIDRIKRLETLSELAEWKKYWKNKNKF